MVFLEAITKSDERTVKVALKSLEWSNWKEYIKQELKNLNRNEARGHEPPLHGIRPLPSWVILKLKRN